MSSNSQEITSSGSPEVVDNDNLSQVTTTDAASQFSGNSSNQELFPELDTIMSAPANDSLSDSNAEQPVSAVHQVSYF